MAFIRLNALFLLQLSVLLFVVGVHTYPLPPAAAPKPAIKMPPVKPPTASSPVYPPPLKKKIVVVVQGVVYCKTVCKYINVNTLLGASPLQGAVVKLVCNNTKNSFVEQTTTDKNGYFFFMLPKLSTAGARGCRVVLVKSPNPKCSAPTNINRGSAGAVPVLIPAIKKQQSFAVHNVGPFAFEPAKKYPCH